MEECNDGGSEKRPAQEVLHDLVKAIKGLELERDMEWNFVDNHGYDSVFWSDDENEEHSEILDAIQSYRNEVQRLAREATGDDKLEI